MAFIIPEKAGIWDITDFLFGVRMYDDWYGNYDKKKYDSYKFFHALPVTSEYIDSNIATHKTDLYLDRYGMDYTGIIDPSGLYDSGNTARTIHQLNWIGSNINRLYR